MPVIDDGAPDQYVLDGEVAGIEGSPQQADREERTEQEVALVTVAKFLLSLRRVQHVRHRYTANAWRELRYKALMRDRWCCTVCGASVRRRGSKRCFQ